MICGKSNLKSKDQRLWCITIHFVNLSAGSPIFQKKARKAENYKCPFVIFILWGNMCPLACHTGDAYNDDVFAYWWYVNWCIVNDIDINYHDDTQDLLLGC